MIETWEDDGGAFVAEHEAPRWYCFEVGAGPRRGAYIGKTLTTEEEIRGAIPHLEIVGNLVRVLP